ncbi:glycosyltransferase family 39 protein [bacterium]|nr:glycosyltransferase family 39 protein [bacterium]
MKRVAKKVAVPIFISLILLLGTFLRLHQIGSKSLWLDEACSLSRAEKAFLPMIKDIAKNDAHPPLYNALLHFWVYEGRGEGWMRGLSSLFGILTILVIYKFASFLFGRRVGLISALIIAFSSYQVFYAQEARLQTLVTLLILLSLYFFYRSLKEGRTVFWLAFILFTILSLYTFFYSFFILLVENIFFFLNFKRYRNAFKIFIISQIGILLLFLPWMPVLAQRMQLAGVRHSFSPPFSTLLSNAWRTFSQFTLGYSVLGESRPEILLGTLVVLAFLFLSLLRAFKERNLLLLKQKNILLLLWLFLPLLAALLIPLKVHSFQSKHIIFASPAYYILIALGLTKLKSHKVSAALLLTLFALNLVSLHIYYLRDFVKEDWRSAAKYVEENSQPRDLILFHPNYIGFAFDYYYGGNLPRVGIHEKDILEKSPKLTANWKRIWLVQDFSPVSRPSREVKDWIEENYDMIQMKEFPGINGKIVAGLYSISLSSR